MRAGVRERDRDRENYECKSDHDENDRQLILLCLLLLHSEEVHSLTRECGMRLYQTSVKENINICNVFLHLAENYVNKVKSRSLMAAAGSAPRRQIGFSNKISSHHHHSSCNPQDYLSNPMFDTLHRRQQWRDKTIKLQRQLTKRRSLQRKLGGGGGGGSGGPGGLSIGGEGTSLCSKML